MSKGAIIGLSVAGLVAALIVVFGFSYVSAYNMGNRYEQELAAVWEDNENILAQYGQKIKEAAQIPAMQREDLLALFTGAIEQRYGSEGSQAMFQWLQEQNPNLNQETYIQLQRMIEAGRNEFRVAQSKLVDTKRAYKTALGSFFTGTMLSMAGYPRVNLDEYKIVTTKRARKAFETGVEEPMKLR